MDLARRWRSSLVCLTARPGSFPRGAVPCLWRGPVTRHAREDGLPVGQAPRFRCGLQPPQAPAPTTHPSPPWGASPSHAQSTRPPPGATGPRSSVRSSRPAHLPWNSMQKRSTSGLWWGWCGRLCELRGYVLLSGGLCLVPGEVWDSGPELGTHGTWPSKAATRRGSPVRTPLSTHFTCAFVIRRRRELLRASSRSPSGKAPGFISSLTSR